MLHRCDRIIKRRRLCPVRDRLHVGQVLPHSLFDRRLEVRVFDPIERRSLIEKRARRVERIGRRERVSRVGSRRWHRRAGRRWVGAAESESGNGCEGQKS